MLSPSKVVGPLACVFLLGLGLSNATQADNAPASADEMNAGQDDNRNGERTAQGKMGKQMKGAQGKLQGSHMIDGELLRVEGENYFVKGQDGKEVRLHTDNTTRKTGHISQGDHIKANLNNQNHALSIRLADSADGNAGRRESLHDTDADHKK